MDDPWAADQAQIDERQRQTIAKLLLVRGAQRAAAIVALSAFKSVPADGYINEAVYNGLLQVPAEIFDRVDDTSKAAINDAAADVIGRSRYDELHVEVQLSEFAPDWDDELLDHLRAGQVPTPPPVDLPKTEEL